VYRLDFEPTATNDLTDMKLLLPLGIRTLGDHSLAIDRLTFQDGPRLIALAMMVSSHFYNEHKFASTYIHHRVRVGPLHRQRRVQIIERNNTYTK
jgi:hypothetical protein